MKTFDAARSRRYQIYGLIFQFTCFVANTVALFFLGYLLLDLLISGVSGLSLDFLTSPANPRPKDAGISSAIVGTLWLMGLTALFAIPMGLGAAIYLEEYARNTRFVRFIKLNIQNLAGVPSIIYGILGVTLFVNAMNLGQSLLAGSLTMALLVLPVITIAAQEALRAVPDSFRLAGYGIGMTRWQVVRYQVLPVASPGILTGIILALSRAIGESAPLLLVGAAGFIAYLPISPMDGYTVLPIQIYNWTARPQEEFHAIAGSAIIVLLVVLLMMNAAAIYLRLYFRKKLSYLHS
ncbi:MAG: phosphate ABC transporter, permease protein PstA [Spirochaetaceae bacterium]|nr:phosphate ABC transporter, permease protein PstA [Spirochaetaceae bacterium]|tara:strand:- start:100698 stop:101579 length:882 start_codon:yes stop_codon:yes gene_type:complete